MEFTRSVMVAVTLSAAGVTACAQVPPPAGVGQIGKIDKNWVQMVDVDTHPEGGTCEGASLKPVPAGANVSADNLFYVPLEPESITITCTYPDETGASRTLERTLHEKSWSAFKSGMVVGALLGGGIIGAAVAGADKPDDNFHYYPFVLNVARPDHMGDPEIAAQAIARFEAKWDAVITAIVRACIQKGGSEKRCSRERDMAFFDVLKSREIEYLNSFSAEPSLPAGIGETEQGTEGASGEPGS